MRKPLLAQLEERLTVIVKNTFGYQKVAGSIPAERIFFIQATTIQQHNHIHTHNPTERQWCSGNT